MVLQRLAQSGCTFEVVVILCQTLTWQHRRRRSLACPCQQVRHTASCPMPSSDPSPDLAVISTSLPRSCRRGTWLSALMASQWARSVQIQRATKQTVLLKSELVLRFLWLRQITAFPYKTKTEPNLSFLLASFRTDIVCSLMVRQPQSR